MKKFIALTLSLSFLIAVVVAAKVIIFLSRAPSQEARPVVFEIPNGMTFQKIAEGLEQSGLITDAFKFKILAKMTGEASAVKVGEYQLFTNMKPHEVLSLLVKGKSIAYSLVVPEGENIFEIKDQLNKMWPGRGDDFFKLVTDKSQIERLTGLKLNSLEGYLFPDTYSLTKYTSTESLIKKMYENFQSTLSDVNKSAQMPLPVREQVILASMIEKETGAPEERPLISSVFHNRLKIKMKLQSDPTIIYGMLVEKGEPVKNITKQDILRPTDYNTYTVKALPVGPISNPGRESLAAAVNPKASKYLFFVSKNEGTHLFSETIQQHNSAVKTYQLNKKAREGKSWRDLNKAKHTSL